MDKWLASSNVKAETSKAEKGPQRKMIARKYDDVFLQLGFTWNESVDDPRPKCVICFQELANESMKPGKLRRHLEGKHFEFKDKPLAFFQLKLDELQALRTEIQKFSHTNEKSMQASYLISLQIAKAGQAHTVGETLVMPAMKAAVEVMLGEKSATEIGKIPLSNSTVQRRISEVSQWIEDEILQRITSSPIFAIQLDESTDVQGLCQLLCFVRYVWNENVHEDMLFCEPILRSTSDVVAKMVEQYFTSKGLRWEKCVGICTDGARAMCGKKSGAVTRLLKHCPLATWTHCSIHREALAAKSMSPQLKEVLNTAVRIINFIKAKPLQARLFEILCKEMGSSHTTLLLHSEVRWLSRGKILTRLVELRDEIVLFLHGTDTHFEELLRDENFIMKLTYLADIFDKLNELNLSLQGSGSTHIFSVHDKIRSFKRKLQLWKGNIEAENFDCFETLETFLSNNSLVVPGGIRREIMDHLQALHSNFVIYFEDSAEICSGKMWVADPFQLNQPSGISTQGDEQLIDLSEDMPEKENFKRKNLVNFWLSLSQKYPILSTEALNLLLPFSSSYLCEVGFSAMVGLKNKYRNRLELSQSLRLKISEIEVDVPAVIRKFRKQGHVSHTPIYQ